MGVWHGREDPQGKRALLDLGRGPKASLDFSVVISAAWIQPGTDVGTNWRNLGFQTQHLGLDPKLEWKKFGKEAFKSLI